MSAANFAKIAIGEGKLYEGDTFDTATELGFTRGAEFDDGYELRNLEVDGKPGDVKGDAVYQTGNPVLNINTMVMSETNLPLLFFGITVETDVPAAGDFTLKRTTANPVDSDYKTFWWVGKLKDGNVWRIKLINALGTGPLSLSFNDKGEVEIPANIKCHFETVDDTELPFEKQLIASV